MLFNVLIKIFLIFSLNNKIVALKEIRLQQEEGTPFTAIREGKLADWYCLTNQGIGGSNEKLDVKSVR